MAFRMHLLFTGGLLGTILFVVSACAYQGEVLQSEYFDLYQVEIFPERTLSFSAELHIRTINLLGQESRSTVKIHHSGGTVRYENLNVEPPEISIIDYQKRKEYQIFEKDHISFAKDIPRVRHLRAQREGLITREANPNIEVMHLPLGKMEVEGHPCEIILEVRTRKDLPTSIAQYTFLWEALDLDRQPLRVAYYSTADTLTVIDYRNIQPGTIDPTLLQLPEGYPSWSPF